MSDKSSDSHPTDRLVAAYNRMMERMKSAIEEAGEQALPTLEENLRKAQEKAVELGELTREEAEKIAGYIKRDMEDAARYLEESGSELREWFRVDLELIEDRLLEMMMAVADRTQLELAEFQKEITEGPPYHTGEITGPGLLRCTSCGEELHFHHTGHIPPCPRCRGTIFRRPPAQDKTDR